MSQKSKSHNALLSNVLTVALVILLIAAVTQSTYSWISRKWSASVSQQRIRIEANNSIAFKLDDNSTDVTNGADLAKLIGGISTFVLKPVSNCTGRSDNFFKLDRTLNNEQFLHIEIQGESESMWTTAGVENGYIESKIYIVGSGSAQDNTTKYVFLNPASHIANASSESGLDAAAAIRVSLTYAGLSNTQTTIVFSRDGVNRVDSDGSKYSYRAISNAQNADKTYIFNGFGYYNESRTARANYREVDGQAYPLTQEVDVTEFSDYTGFVYDGGEKYKDADGANYINADKCLFALPADQTKAVTIRVWLEGEDELCTEDIAGLEIDLLVSFDAITCVSTPVEIGEESNCHKVIEIAEADMQSETETQAETSTTAP